MLNADADQATIKTSISDTYKVGHLSKKDINKMKQLSTLPEYCHLNC